MCSQPTVTGVRYDKRVDAHAALLSLGCSPDLLADAEQDVEERLSGRHFFGALAQPMDSSVIAFAPLFGGPRGAPTLDIDLHHAVDRY